MHDNLHTFKERGRPITAAHRRFESTFRGETTGVLDVRRVTRADRDEAQIEFTVMNRKPSGRVYSQHTSVCIPADMLDTFIDALRGQAT